MNQLLLSIFIALNLSYATAQKTDYQPDKYLTSFTTHTINQPNDYEGEVICTLIKKEASTKSTKAVLYIHGYCDYFFQADYANEFTKRGINFYALDLRKYGRSYLPHQKMFNVRNLNEYYADINSALNIIEKEGNTKILLNAHSTGGLIVSLYANENNNDKRFNAILLNSPFLDMNLSLSMEKLAVPIVAKWGEKQPDKMVKGKNISLYGESLHKNYKGEWDFNLTLKPLKAPNVNQGFITAIHTGHKAIKNKLNINKPILVMYSNNTVHGRKWRNQFYYGDAVLDVKDIKNYSLNLGPYTEQLEVNNGMHDLILSQQQIRLKTYNDIFNWLNKLNF